jgi:serine/threonine-protein kinase
MPSPSRYPVHVGDTVAGKFRVERVLGQGGMGLVVAATHLHLDQRVALKFLLPSVAEHPEIAERFLREARASVRIHSEHVARVLDVGTTEGGVPFMVMEFLEGEDLAQVLSTRGALGVSDAIAFVLQACEAVAEAHSLGMVHRDLKPANLFLARRPSGRPTIKVLDFGISKIPTTDRDRAITQAAAMMGSPGYMSPEQMMSADKVDVRSDIWSLGITLYELLGKRLPFTGITMPELVAAILNKTPEPLSAIRGDVPEGLALVIDTCLQKQPGARYSNVAELARALAPFGPARSEQSVERIEIVLGARSPSSRPSATIQSSIPPPPARQVISAPNGSNVISATFSPTTSRAPRVSGRFIIPGIVAAALVGGSAVLFAVTWLKRPGAAAVPPTTSSLASSLTVASTSPLASGAPSASSPVDSAAPAYPSAVTLITAPTAAPAPPGPTGKIHQAPSPAHNNAGAPSASTAPPVSSAPPPTPASSCHMVTYFDDMGIKHFTQECP